MMNKTISIARAAALATGMMVYASTGLAVGISAQGILPEGQQAAPVPETLESDSSQVNWQEYRYRNVPAPLQASDEEQVLQPFGAHLFSGGFSGIRSDGLNAGYKVVPGDQITLRIWGAVEVERVLPVDAQGNVFVPSIGPIKVQGVTQGQLQGLITSAIKSVYPEGVEVYTNLQGVQPVSVFVTGYVNNPGRYAGTPTDSLLYFIDQAGGIDPQLGSYRQIEIIRDGRTLAEADLYDFLLEGKLARPQLQDGDTILVSERGPAVVVTGDVERDYRYELRLEQMSGKALLELARTRTGVSHVLLRGSRESGPVSQYLALNDFSEQALRSGDELLFSSDQRDEMVVVQLEGSFYGPSRYAVPRNTRLQSFLDTVAVPKGMTDTESVSIRRLSVAEQQKAALKESLRRLETYYLGASSATPQEAEIRVKEAELIRDYARRAAQNEPSGRLVVAHNGEVSNIRLQDGDVITLPEVNDAVLISGEVLVPQSVVFQPGLTALDYIEGAGGFTQHADDDRILVARLNGEVRDAGDIELKPGDEILVLPAVPTKNLQLASTLSQILYQLALSYKVIVDL